MNKTRQPNNSQKDCELPSLEQKAGDSMVRSSHKFIVLLLAIGICLVILHFSPAKELLTNIETLKENIRAAGVFAPLLFFAVSVLLSAIGIPRLGLTLAAGMLFGFKLGLPLALGSTLIGSYSTFCIARWCGKSWAEKVANKSQRINFLMENQSISTVFLSRQLPITNVAINLLFSLTTVKHRIFIAGSLLGFIPGALVATLSGNSLGKESFNISFFQLGLAGIIVLVSVITVWKLKKRWPKEYANKCD